MLTGGLIKQSVVSEEETNRIVNYVHYNVIIISFYLVNINNNTVEILISTRRISFNWNKWASIYFRCVSQE